MSTEEAKTVEAEVVAARETSLQKFRAVDAVIADLRERYEPLQIEGPEDDEGFRAVDEARKDVKSHKIAVERLRKELVEDAVAWQKTVNAEAKRVGEPLKALEGVLAGRVEEVKVERKRLAKEAHEAAQRKLAERMKALFEVGAEAIPSTVEALSDEEFAEQLEAATKLHEEREAAAAEEKAKLERETRERELKLERTADRVHKLAQAGVAKLPREVANLSDEEFEAMLGKAQDAQAAAQAAEQAEADRLAQEEAKRREEAAQAETRRREAQEEADRLEQAAKMARARLRGDRQHRLAEFRYSPEEGELDLDDEAFEALVVRVRAEHVKREREAEEKRKEAEEARRKREEERRSDSEKLAELARFLSEDLEIPQVWCTAEIDAILARAIEQILALANELREPEV